MKQKLSDAERDRYIREWVLEYGPVIQRTCTLYLSDRTLVEDVVQETFLKAWNHMDQFEGRNNCQVRTWLTRIAINACRDVQRTKWFRNVDTSVDAESVLALHGESSESDRMLLMDVLRLPDKYRTVVLLYYYQNMTQQEVADVLQISRSKVCSRLKKALDILKIEWKEEESR